MFSFRRTSFLFLALIIFYSNSYSQSSKIILKGLRIFSQPEISRILGLNLNDTGISNVRITIYKIKSFYLKNGYPLIEVYNLASRDDNIHLFIDEGRLGRIVVTGLNSYYALKVKQVLRFPGNVYNQDVLDNNSEMIKENFLTAEVSYELVKVKDYSGNFFQLDEHLKSIDIMNFELVRIFDDYPPAYNLYIHVKKRDGFLKGRNEGGDSSWGMGLRIGFPSELKPRVYYKKRNLLFQEDRLDAEISAGLDAGLDSLLAVPPELKFNPPEYTFSRFTVDYSIPPGMGKHFSPVYKSDVYHSKSSREDIGLETYRYLKVNEILAPGVNFLGKFNLYTGFGYEFIVFHENTYEDFSEEYGADEKMSHYPYLEAQVSFDPFSWFIGLRKSMDFSLKYQEFFKKIKSREFEATGLVEKEFKNLSILSFKFRGNFMFLDVPFYHQSDVSSDYFKGFTGKGFYSSKQLSLSSEYRFSVYQDYIYSGFFVDYTVFEAYGEEIYGNKRGIVAGTLLRVLFYDQFEFGLYWGMDRLFPDRESQWNLKMNLSKKW